MKRSVLITTLPPTRGGVPTKTRILAEFLRRCGNQVTIAHYATISEFGRLSATSWELLFGKRPLIDSGTCFDDFSSVAVGCKLPELEFNYYRKSDLWRQALDGYDRHIAVGGTVLVSNPLVELGIPHMTWCASTMIDDRYHRRQSMPPARRIIDAALIGPVQRSMEKRILSAPTRFMTVSDYARRSLIEAGGNPDHFTTVPVPVDTNLFSPPSDAPVGVIGFAGRADDPRKNILLLLDAFRIVAGRNQSVELLLTGDPTSSLDAEIRRRGISDRVRWSGWLDRAGLIDFYRKLDVFVFPSHKEGLGIAGIEAMASGVPVVSTRSGGPEDYVIDGETGWLVDDNPAEMADAITSIYNDRSLRERMGANARDMIAGKYAINQFEVSIAANWYQTWGETL